MNIACLVRGPIRPSAENVINNLNLFINNIDLKKYNIDFYLGSWQEYKQQCLYIKRHFKNLNIKIILAQLTQQPVFINNTFNRLNCYKQFILSDFCIKNIQQIKKYDFIIHTRTDIKISINLEQWLNKETYTTIHSKQNGSKFTNDQFSVAPSDIMISVWNIKNLEQQVQFTQFPEHLLDHSLSINKIKTLEIQPDIWELDPLRHKTEI